MTANLWWLTITTFRGRGDPRAIHYYASLNSNTQKMRVERVMTADEADAMNDRDEICGRDYMGQRKEGDPTNRFDTEDEAIAAGAAVWLSVKGEDDGLVRGSADYGGIWLNVPYDDFFKGPEAFVAAVRPLFEQAKKLNWWDTRANYDKMRVVADAYTSLLEAQFGGSDKSDNAYERRQANEHDEYVRRLPDGGWEHLPGFDPYKKPGVDYTATLEAP